MFKSLFNVTEPTAVWYAEKPPRLGGIPAQISIKSLEEKVGDGFQYTENLWLRGSETPAFPKVSIAPSIRNEILNCLQKPSLDKLMICQMNQQVGFGIFARQAIAFGEIVAIYAGEISSTQELKQTEYALTPYCPKEDSKCDIDARHKGGIARFFQHLPHFPQFDADTLIAKFKSNPEYLRRFFELNGELHWFTEMQRQQTIDDILYKDLTVTGGQFIKKMLSSKKAFDYSEEKHLNLKVSFDEVAQANLNMSALDSESNKPIIYFFANRNIAAGDQLGFHYGYEYWYSRGDLPLLFDLNGAILSRDLYKYTRMPFPEKIQHSDRVFFYTKNQYLADIEAQNPVQLFIGTHPCSFFQMRKSLVRGNVIGKNHLPSEPNSLVFRLKKLLPQDVEIELFERNPSAIEKDKQAIYDVVLTAKTLQRWAQLTKLFSQNKIIGQYCKSFQFTRELIIKGANCITDELTAFLKSDTEQEWMKFFATEIPAKDLPHEPDGEVLHLTHQQSANLLYKN